MTEFENSNRAHSNDVLHEQLRQVRREIKEIKLEIKELEKENEHTRRIAESANNSMSYVKESVGEMKSMMSSFIDVVNTQNDKIDEFINSDRRRDAKKELIVSVLQVFSGIVIALITFWATGQL